MRERDESRQQPMMSSVVTEGAFQFAGAARLGFVIGSRHPVTHWAFGPSPRKPKAKSWFDALKSKPYKAEEEARPGSIRSMME